MPMPFYKKRDQTTCARGCKGVIIDKAKGVYCKHIESKLPKSSGQSIKGVRVGYSINEVRELISPTHLSPEQIEWKLRKAGLDQYETELLLLRYVEGKRMKEIVEIQGWTSLNSANYYLRKTLSKLKKKEFRLR